MDRKALFHLVLALWLAIVGVVVLLGLLAGTQKQVHAAPPPSPPLSPPVGGMNPPSLPPSGGDAPPSGGDERGGAAAAPAPPPGPARAPAASPPATPLSQGSPTVITVCSSCPYTTVQAAVSGVATGGIVKVAQGVYTDTDGDGRVVELTKTLTLQGGYTTTNWTTPDPVAHPTILDGEGTAQVVRIATSIAPVIEGFHIRSGYTIDDGGGIYITGGEPTLRRNRIYSNTATNNGGGVYIAGGAPVLENNLIYTNTAVQKRGGGVYVAGGAILHHNTLYDNQADGEGGGIYIYSGSPIISATIVVSNAASSGGGVYRYGGTPALDYNDVWGNNGGDYGGGVFPGTHSTSTNPLFINPAGADFHLQAGSPCIDQVPVTQTVGVDYEGRARPFGERADIGAHEFYTGTCFVRIETGRVYTTVQAAVDAAGAGDLVRVAGVCQGVLTRTVGINIFTQTVYISQGLTLQGGYTVTNWSTSDPNANPTILDAQAQGRVVYIDSTAAVVVEGLHIRSGNVPGTSDDGGGLYIAGGDHVIRESKIYSNTVGNNGGGIYVAGGSPMIRDNDIYSNTAAGGDGYDGGGGIYVAGGSAVVQDNDIYSNTASLQEGGGINIYAGSATVRDNDIYSNTASVSGGGIYIYSGDQTVQDNSIHHNKASSSGGGIYVRSGSAMVRGNDIHDNTASGSGGGIRIETGSSVVESNTIYSNTAGSSGGGIYLRKQDAATATVRHNTICSNTAQSGGGIDAGEGLVIIEDNQICGNSATSSEYGGGGILAWSNDKTIRGNTIHDNTATNGPGGGICFNTAGGTVENNLIHGNTASTSNGGGIYIRNASPTIQNNTIYSNVAQSNGGGGIYRNNGSPTIRNNVVVSNTNWGVYGSVTVYYSDIWGNTTGQCGGGASCAAGDGNIEQNPDFVNPGVDFHLQQSSPCIDAADPNNYADTDYDGYARPFGTRADMGAYEFYTGTCFARVGNSQVYTTVQAAVDAAGSGAQVSVGGTCTGVETRAGVTQTVYISQPLTLRGGYTLTNWTSPTTQAILDAQGLGRGVYITGTGGITVDGFILRGGTAITGGGLYVAVPLSPTVQNIIFYSNTADYGGGFASAGGSPRLYNDTFVTNTATYSGGAAYFDAGFPVVSNTIVVSNAAPSGGGLFATANATPTLAYNDVWQNTGGNYAGNVTTGTTDFSADPLFVDFAAADFHLRADSPGIHTGDPGTTLETDFEGDTRPLGRGYDVGADESTTYPDVIFAPPLWSSGIPGQSVVYNHTLTNSGSISDTFDLTHTLAISGPGTGWSVGYTSVFTLPAGGMAAVPVTVSVPADAISGTQAVVVLTATSRANSTIYDVVSNTTIVNWNPGVAFTPLYTEHANPGTVITYVHTLTNTGNTSDTFQITWSSSRGWAGVTPTQIVDLGPWMMTTVWVSVSVPATAPGGLVETTVVTASGDSGVQAVVTDTTTVNHTTGDRYVATTGDDTLNNCLVYTYPCATIVYAIGQAASGDTIKVAAGTYDEHDVTLNKNITLRGGYTTGDWGTFDPDTNITIIDGQGLGRVLYIFGSPTVEGFTLQGGSTTGSGGGVYVSLGAPVLRRNVITGNTASYGGGVYNGQGNPTLERNVLAFNTADRGGGFASGSGSPGFWSNLVYENTASVDGGGVYVAGGSPRIWHNTLYSNTADTGGGLYLAGGSPVVSNTIVVSNAASSGGGVYRYGGTPALDYNDVWGNAGGDYAGLSAGSHSISTNPLFVDAAGGDLHLQEDSPCIDIGDATLLAEDFDGQPRTMGDAPDIGADEFQRAGVELEPDRTGSGYPGDTITYTHTLTNTGNYSDTFTFTAQSSQGWPVTPPAPVELGAGFTTTVPVELQIPAGTLSGTVDTTVLTATSGLNGAVHDTVVDTTTVGLARGVLLVPDHISWADSNPSQTVEVVYTHRLTNTGNTTDTFGLTGESSQGWTVVVAPTGATLAPGAGIPVWVTVTVPAVPTTTLYVDTTVVTATSQSDNTVYDTATDTTIVNQRAGVLLEPDNSGSGAPGATIDYYHTLTNTGNYTDTFDLAIAGWGSIVGPTQVTLGAGMTTTVHVQVTVPSYATCGTVDTTVVTATSQFDPTVYDMAVDTTTVEPTYSVALDPDHTAHVSSSATQEVSVTYTHRLTNTGNCGNTFTLTVQSSLGFTVTVVPTSVTLPGGGVAPVTVTVTVPPTDTGCLNLLVDTTVVTANGSNGGSATATDTTIVNRCAGVALAPDNTAVITQPFIGSVDVWYTHILTNTGNYSDIFDLTGQSEHGWGVTVNPVEVTLGSGLTTTVQVQVTVPWNVYTITDRTVVTATSQFSPTAQATAVNTTTVRRPHVTLYPNYSRSAAPGTVITYVHTLTNSGGVSDTYVITYAENLGWSVTVTPTTVYTLPPGSAVGVTATVSVPAGTLASTKDTLVITATSQITDVVFDIATDETTVPYVPGAVIAPDRSGQADPGGTITYTHILTNTGNYTETFDLTTHSTFGYAEVSPATVAELGPGVAYTGVVVTVQLPTHAAAGETEQTQVIVSFAGEQVVAWDSTQVNPITGTRYVAPNGRDENNNCTDLNYDACATMQHAVDQAATGDEVRVAYGVYTDVHATGVYTQVVYLEESLTLRGGYATDDWDTAAPVARPTVLDAAGQGRVVYVAGGITPTIEGFHLRRGYVNGDGAGLYIAAGAEPRIAQCHIYSNTASGIGSKGGGVYYGGTGNPVFERNTIYSNTAEDGGGVYLAGGSPAVWNSVIYRNTAGDLGGGLYNGSGSPTVWNNTFYSNTADSGGGVYIAGGSPVISNTIIVNNANYGIYRSAGTPALAYNDVWGNVPANRFGVSAGTGSISADPRFVDQAAYDLHLRGASPCIDAGDPNTTLNADRDGNLRPLLSGYDIGAYEYGLMSAKTVATTADPGAVITYTIVVTNTGSASRTIPVTDTLHLYLDYAGLLTYTAGSGEYIAASRTVSWTGPVGGNSTAYITFTARITDWLAVGVPITNVAWVDFAATSVVTTTANSVPGTRHVAQTAASTDVHNNCRVTWKPCTTVQWAVDQALTGDGVRVATGVYTDVLGAGQVVSVSKSITLTGGYTFTIWAYSPDVYATTLEAQGGGQGMVITGPVTVTVAGFRVASATDGVMVYTATAVISRCRVYSNSGDGIHVTGGAFTLERTWVYSNTGDGVEVEGGTYALVNNVVAHNEGAGLRTAGSEGTLKHNTFARNDVAGAVISNTARFTNTIFYSHTVGVSVTTGSTAYLSYTVWYSNTANQGTLISSTNYYSNPLFYDPEGLNYHIQSGSGALDTGVEAGVSEDIDGGPRPLLAGPDIGADEFPLRVTKGAPSTADPGQIITYTITLEGDATGLVLTDTLPTYVDYVSDSVTCSVGTTCGYLTAQRAITWTGDITSGQPAYITYTARITTWLAAGVQVVNDADVQIGDDLLHTAPVATTINGVPGTRYVATTGTDADNSCRMEWKPCATVQYAVDQALAGDTVKVAEGAYTGAGSNVVLITESLTLQGGYTTTNWNASDPVAYPTYLDGQSVRRVVYITGPVTVTVAGFHIVNGDTPLSAEKYGGGLYIYTSTVHLARSWVYNNQALYSGDRGGGIYQEYGSLTITATQVYSNISNSTGGGIYYRDGTFALVNSQVYSNTAGSSGGGLYLTYADVTLTGNRVYTNTAQGGTANGGGVDLYRCYDQLLERNLFLDNQAGDRGGGIYEYALSTSMLTMTNNIIAANRADTGGDGLYLAGASSAQGHLRHNTVADNAEEGLRVGNFTVVMTNTVLVSHTVGITTSAAGASVTADHTLWYATAIYTDASGGGTILTTDDLSGDPKFVDLAILDYHIRGDSAALDAGVWAGVSEDIDGDARPAGQAPDIGADQYPLRVARWVGPASALPCGVVTHTLRLTNLSTAPLAGVWLSDTLDANATFAGFVTASAGSAAYVAASHTISWTGPVDTLAPTFITYTAQITPYLTDGTLLTHTATVSDGISVFDAASITVTVATEQATLKKSAPAQAAIGQVVTYTIAFTVPAGHVAYQPTVTDTLPRLVTGAGLSTTPALTYVVGSGSPSPLAVSPDGGGITWTLPTVTATCGAPAVVTVTFGAQVQNLPDNGAGDLLTNTVTLSYTESTANGPAHLVTTTQTASLVEPAPAITKGMTPDADLGSLDTLTVTVTLTNTGTGHLYDVVVTDTLPTGLAFLDATPGHSVNGQDVTWTVDSLGVGQQQVFTITARVAETIGANEMLINEVEVHGTSRPGLVDEERAYTDTAQAIAATGYPDLVIGKERGPAVRSPGQPITYIIVYTNTGVVRAENVRITDTLPALLTDVISATSAEATVDHVGQAIIWTLTAPVSRTVTGTIWLTATVSPAAQEGATLTNTVTIAATTTEQNTGNNTALVTTAIHLPSLHITKTVEPAAVLPGDLLTYTLTVSNTWLGEATGLLISDTVPSNTSYQSCSGGDSCSESGGVVIWTVAALPAGEQVQVSFTVRVGADVKYGTSIVNQTYAVSCIQGVTAEGAPVSIPVGLVGGVVLEPDRTGSGLPGEAVVYHHVLTNTANVAQTIGLDASSSEGWQVNVSPTSVQLAAGAPTSIVVTVTVGGDAISGTVDTTVVTATGSLIGFDIATDRTTVGCVPVSGADFTYSPPAPLVGQTVTFTGTVALASTSPIVYTWNFDDGSAEAQGQVVTHVYGSADSYTVVMTATNPCGTAYTSHTIIVNPYRIYLPVVLRNY